VDVGTVGHGRTHQAVLLDLFGTLVDFHSVFVSTLDRIMADNGLEDRREDFRHRWSRFVFQGQSGGSFVTVRRDFEDSLVTVLVQLGQEGQLDSYSRTVIGEMFDQLRDADLFAEVPDVIAAIEAEGIPWGIVSNVDEEELQAIVSNQGLRPVTAVSSERVRSYKPDSAIFTVALEEMGLPADSVIHVGDSPMADVAGATGAGLASVWVNRYHREFPEALPRPVWVMTDLRGLPGLLLKD
jgi:2-haloalkanoic acid dehalogenase type II